MDGKVLDDDAVAMLRRLETADAECTGTRDADPLRAELEGLLRVAGVREEHRPAVARLLGWDGSGGATTRSVSRELGIAVEDLRRAEEQVRDHVSRGVASTPVLDAALGVLEETWPATSATAAVALRSRGLSIGIFDPAGVLRAAKLLHRRTDLVIEQGSPCVVTKRGFKDVAAGVGVACALAVAGRAVATVDDVLAHLAGGHDASRWRILVGELVDADGELEWLDARHRCFGRAGLTREVSSILGRVLDRDGEYPIADALALLAEDPAIGPGIGKRLLSAICARAEDLEIDGDLLRRPAAAREAEPSIEASVDDLDMLDIEAAARRAALVEVLRARPETSLGELCDTEGEAGQWLRSSTIVDLAVAALQAGVDRSRPRGVVERKRPPIPEPSARADQLSFDLEPSASADPLPESEPADVDRSAREPNATATIWSSGASSLSLAVAVPPRDASEASGETEEEDPGSHAPVGESDIIAALRVAPSLTIAELEVAVGGLRSRVRRLVRQLEATGLVRREGVARWTRYRLAAAGDPVGDGSAPVANDHAVRSAPIRRRRGDVEGVRILYYRSHAGADPQKVAAIVLRDHAITIEYAEGQRPFDALERIMTTRGVVTPGDGLRYWAALESAFSTSSHFFVSGDPS